MDRLTPLNWPLPTNVRAFSTTRLGGHSQAPFDSNNFALHVGDEPHTVEANRLALIEQLKLPNTPYWLDQNHSDLVVNPQSGERTADASYSQTPGTVCVVMTADCLPILLCDQQGSTVAAIHAGWRGLLNGIIENTLAALPCAATDCLVWYGPCIGPTAFYVGAEVRNAFIQRHAENAAAFTAIGEKWLMNCLTIADRICLEWGITQRTYSHACTYSDPKHYFSYRRDGQTGRLAHGIYLL